MTTRQRLRAISLGLTAAPAAMLGFAYYAQYVMGLLPCILCLYQRPPLYVAAAAALLAFATVGGPKGLSRAFLGFAGIAFLVGAGIAVFHAGVEWKFWPGLAECGGSVDPIATNINDLVNGMETAKIVRCDEAAWVFLGLSMAGWNAVISSLLAVIAFFGMVQGQLKGRFRA
jgi:disulfide bond formation protein DsbB